jgi:hypothetical protein
MTTRLFTVKRRNDAVAVQYSDDLEEDTLQSFPGIGERAINGDVRVGDWLVAEDPWLSFGPRDFHEQFQVIAEI